MNEAGRARAWAWGGRRRGEAWMEAGVVPWVAQRSELDHNMSKQVIAGQRQFCVCVCGFALQKAIYFNRTHPYTPSTGASGNNTQPPRGCHHHPHLLRPVRSPDDRVFSSKSLWRRPYRKDPAEPEPLPRGPLRGGCYARGRATHRQRTNTGAAVRKSQRNASCLTPLVRAQPRRLPARW